MLCNKGFGLNFNVEINYDGPLFFLLFCFSSYRPFIRGLSELKVHAIPPVTVSQDDFGAPLNIQGTSLGHLALQPAPLKPCGKTFNLCAS